MADVVDIAELRRTKKLVVAVDPASGEGSHDGYMDYVIGLNGKVETRDEYEQYKERKKRIEQEAKDRL